MTNGILIKISALLKAFANPRRLEILFYLRSKELNVGELEQKIGLSQSALSQHLAVLRRAHVVTTRRKAQTIYYSLSGHEAQSLLDLLHKLFNS